MKPFLLLAFLSMLMACGHSPKAKPANPATIAKPKDSLINSAFDSVAHERTPAEIAKAEAEWEKKAPRFANLLNDSALVTGFFELSISDANLHRFFQRVRLDSFSFAMIQQTHIVTTHTACDPFAYGEGTGEFYDMFSNGYKNTVFDVSHGRFSDAHDRYHDFIVISAVTDERNYFQYRIYLVTLHRQDYSDSVFAVDAFQIHDGQTTGRDGGFRRACDLLDGSHIMLNEECWGYIGKPLKGHYRKTTSRMLIDEKDCMHIVSSRVTKEEIYANPY